MSSENKSRKDTLNCIACGAEIPSEDDAVYGFGGVKPDGAVKLFDGETVSASELFGFDDGPYCSLNCSMEGDDAN